MSISANKLFLCLAVVLLAVCVAMAAGAKPQRARSDEAASEASYQAWCAKYNKGHCTGAALRRRSDDYVAGLQQYRDHVALVERHNANKTNGWKMQVNEYFRVSTIGRSKRGNIGNPDITVIPVPPTVINSGQATAAGGTYTTGIPPGLVQNCIPDSVTAWTPGGLSPLSSSVTDYHLASIPPVQDQGQCAACGAFVAVDIFTTRYPGLCPNSGVTATSQLVSCTDSTRNNNQYTTNQGCSGGFTTNYFDYMNTRLGMVCTNNGRSDSSWSSATDAGSCSALSSTSVNDFNFYGPFAYNTITESQYLPAIYNYNKAIAVYFHAGDDFASAGTPVSLMDRHNLY